VRATLATGIGRRPDVLPELGERYLLHDVSGVPELCVVESRQPLLLLDQHGARRSLRRSEQRRKAACCTCDALGQHLSSPVSDSPRDGGVADIGALVEMPGNFLSWPAFDIFTRGPRPPPRVTRGSLADSCLLLGL
jgi:hypothetical protein